MRLEILREISEALTSTAYGLAVQLSTMPRDSGNAVPATPLVIDGTKDNEVFKGEQLARGSDTLVIVVGGTLRKERGNIKGEFSVGVLPVGFLVFHAGNKEDYVKAQEVEYLMRAITLVIEAYFRLESTGRIRNEVCIMDCPTGCEYDVVYDNEFGARGEMLIPIRALDKRAQRLK